MPFTVKSFMIGAGRIGNVVIQRAVAGVIAAQEIVMVAFRAVGDLGGSDADAVAVDIDELTLISVLGRVQRAKGVANLTIAGRFNVLMIKSCAPTSSSREPGRNAFNISSDVPAGSSFCCANPRIE